MAWNEPLLKSAWQTALPTAEKFVLVALATHANADGEAWPSVRTLCDRTGCSKSTVQRALRGLEAAGHIWRVEVDGRGWLYRVHPVSPASVAKAARPKPRPPEEGNTAPDRSHHETGVTMKPVSPRPVTGVRVTQNRCHGDTQIKKELPVNTAAAAPPDPAKAFWDEAIAYLGSKARSQIGKWIRDHGLPAVRAALDAARKQNDGAGAANPVAYMAAALRNGAEREAQRVEEERRAQASFDRRFPPRVITEDEARALMEPDEFTRWQQRQAARQPQTVDPKETDLAAQA